MKRTHIYTYEIWGSVVEWPVKVYLSSSDVGSWKVDFEYVDPEARTSVSHSAKVAEDFIQIAEERNMDIEGFIKALQSAKQAEVRTLGDAIEGVHRSAV